MWGGGGGGVGGLSLGQTIDFAYFLLSMPYQGLYTSLKNSRFQALFGCAPPHILSALAMISQYRSYVTL